VKNNFHIDVKKNSNMENFPYSSARNPSGESCSSGGLKT